MLLMKEYYHYNVSSKNLKLTHNLWFINNYIFLFYRALKFLELKNLQFVKEQKTIDQLKAKLPSCNILYEPVNE